MIKQTVFLFFAVLLQVPAVFAAKEPGQIIREIKFDQRLDAPLPLDLEFRDENNQAVRISDYFGKKPVLLNFVYFRCPMLCSMVMNGLTSALRVLSFQPGKEFEILTISIDPTDTPEAALDFKSKQIASYAKSHETGGWHFLTGGKDSIETLAKAIGFQYLYDERSRQFAHAGGAVVATPEGKLARYFYGIEFSPKDIRFALMEASKGKIGSLVDQLLLLCYHYDPMTGRYGLWITGILRICGLLTLGILAGFVGLNLYRERKQKAGVN